MARLLAMGAAGQVDFYAVQMYNNAPYPCYKQAATGTGIETDAQSCPNPIVECKPDVLLTAKGFIPVPAPAPVRRP